MEFCTANTGLGTSYIMVPDPKGKVYAVEPHTSLMKSTHIRSPLRQWVSGGDDGTRYTR